MEVVIQQRILGNQCPHL